MNRTLLFTMLAATVLSGCRIRNHADPGDITFSWSFAGASCADAPEVSTVRVVIPGEILQNDGYFPCLVGGYPGVVLHDFAPGTYSFQLEALSNTDQVLYVAAGTVTVDGDVRATVDLTPYGVPSSWAYLTWRFPGQSTPSCSAAGVVNVDVKIDNGSWRRYACALGITDPGAKSEFVDPGNHNIEVVALDADGYARFDFKGTLSTLSGNPVGAQYNLAWAIGGASISWTLYDGMTEKTCGSSGVTSMNVNFKDSNGQWVYTNGDIQACAAEPVVYAYLAPGTYQVYIQGTGSGPVQYNSSTVAPETITVVGGQFPASSAVKNIPIYRQ
jgi:hypothetical protein